MKKSLKKSKASEKESFQVGKSNLKNEKRKLKIDIAHDSYHFLEKKLMDSIKNGGKISSTFYAIFFQNDELRILPVDMDQAADADDRRMIGAVAGKMLAEQKKDVYAFGVIAEAWKREKEKRTGEIFLSMGKDIDGNVKNQMYTINREKNGTVTFSPMSESDGWEKPKKKDESIFPLLDVAWESYRLVVKK
jgi:hypothetical protein